MASLARRLWRALPFVKPLPSDGEYAPLLASDAPPKEKAIEPPSLFFVSPAQLWIGPLISRVNKAGAIEEDWLPRFTRSATSLRAVFAPLRRTYQQTQQHDEQSEEQSDEQREENSSDASILPFLLQFEIGGMLLLGAILEVLSSASTLGAPLVLHNFLQTPDSEPLAWTLVAVTLLATFCGRAKDEVCRVHAAWVECMLRTVIFDKSFHLSPAARLENPAAKVININAVDVGFLTNYVVKIHDVWSAPLQIIGIAVLTFNVMGWTSCFGFAIVGIIFTSQTSLSKRLGKSVGGYILQNDKRLSLFRDLFNNIKSVKASALENVFHRKITSTRKEQLEPLRHYLTMSFAIFTAVNQTIPNLAACAAFLAYAMSGAQLTYDIVFPCLAYFHLLYQPVTLASMAISRQFSVRPSLRRVRILLTAQESRMSVPGSDGSTSSAVSFKAARFEWPAEQESDRVSLQIGNLEIPRGQMTAIIGPNGGGKTSLLQAMLGEMTSTAGTCFVNGSVAYCAQDPWIMSGTLGENIVFNSPRGYDTERYKNVIQACGLDRDFSKPPGGVEGASVGEAGSNLSGGQRARVSLARALYSDADILLLDDPLSALDAHVRGDLFQSIRQLKKTVILVTLHTSYISQVDQVVVVENSKLRYSGSRQDFQAQTWISDYIRHEEHSDSEDSTPGQDSSNTNKTEAKAPQDGNVKADDSDEAEASGASIDSIWQEEERARGTVEWDVAKFYIRVSGGMTHAIVILIMTCLLTAAKVISQYWFVWWIGDTIGLTQGQYMGSFLSLTLFQGIVSAGVGLTLVTSSLKATRHLHETILENLIAAPLWFFHQNPTGRILNRLSRDVESMDISIMNAVDGLIAAGTTMFASIAIVASSGIFLFAAVLPFLFVVGYCLQRFRVTAREIQRLDAVLQSPALSIVKESLRAPSSAKAYRAVPYLVARHGEALDRLTAAKISRSSLDTWITFRSELAAALVLLILALLTVKGVISYGSASLALGTATTLARNIYLLAWAATDLEIQLNAVERLQVYHDRIPCEDKETPFGANRNGQSDDGWPKSSTITIRNAYLQYKTRPTPALDSITLTIEKGQKVGLVGRTGSGKSTLISAIARLVDIQDGTISIGGTNTASIPPRRLRQSVITLPQETLIVQGTLRENVDPHGRHTDQEIWDTLESCQMRAILQGKYGEAALEQQLSSDGADLSAGQRQLVCAARVLLERPAVLLVDEASANVDFSSDEALQRAWQSLSPETTMVTIAHRASSLAWMDRVLVMENGKVVEDGSPRALLESSHDSEGSAAESYYRTSIQQDGPKALERALNTAMHWDSLKHGRGI